MLEVAEDFRRERWHMLGGDVTREREARQTSQFAVPGACCSENQLLRFELVLQRLVEKGAIEEVVPRVGKHLADVGSSEDGAPLAHEHDLVDRAERGVLLGKKLPGPPGELDGAADERIAFDPRRALHHSSPLKRRYTA